MGGMGMPGASKKLGSGKTGQGKKGKKLGGGHGGKSIGGKLGSGERYLKGKMSSSMMYFAVAVAAILGISFAVKLIADKNK